MLSRTNRASTAGSIACAVVPWLWSGRRTRLTPAPGRSASAKTPSPRRPKNARRNSILAMVHACRARAANELVATLLPSNQVLVEGVYVLVGRDPAIDARSIQANPAGGARELFAVAGHHQQPEPVVVQFDFGDVILTEE